MLFHYLEPQLTIPMHFSLANRVVSFKPLELRPQIQPLLDMRRLRGQHFVCKFPCRVAFLAQSLKLSLALVVGEDWVSGEFGHFCRASLINLSSVRICL